MVQKKNLKIVLVVVMFIVLLFNHTDIFAAINNYGGSGYQEITEEAIEQSAKSDNPLVQPLASLIYFAGNLIQWILGMLSRLISGEGASVYPWADAILFNAVPMLDVNFINPSTGSLIAKFSGIIRTIYFTMLSISITLFGVAVIAMAVKLVTSVIATEKAKYKEMITKWAMGLVLLFTMHYLISFVFFANESMVKVASTLTIQALGDKELKIDTSDLVKNLDKMKDDVESKWSFWDTFKWGDFEDIKDTMESNPQLIEKILYTYNSAPNDELLSNLMPYIGDKNGLAGFFAWVGNPAKTDKTTIAHMADLIEAANNFSNNQADFKKLKQYYSDAITAQNKNNQNDLAAAKQNIANILDSNKSDSINDALLVKIYGGQGQGESVMDVKLGGVKTYIDIIQEATVLNGSGSKKNLQDIINSEDPNAVDVDFSAGGSKRLSPVANLAEYFKYASFTSLGDSIIANKQSVIGALLYTVFVAQSLLFFIAYLKRLYYVIILGVMAPVIVVFDFLSETLGLKQGTLSSWLKEFFTTVFIQTLQAFLFAIVVVLIVNLSNLGTSGVSGQQKNAGIAIVAIIGLASIDKIENLVKKLIGFESGLTDASMRGGFSSLLGTIAVAGMVKKQVGDNFGKISGGIRDIKSAKGSISKERKRYNQKMSLTLGDKTVGNVSTDSKIKKVDTLGGASEYYNKAKQAKARGNMAEYYKNREMAAQTMRNEKSAAPSSGSSYQNGPSNSQPSNSNIRSKPVSGDSRSTSMSNSDRLKVIEENMKHEDKINELKAKRKASSMKAISGVAEFGGAAVGGVAGGAIGLSSTGEVDDLIKGAGMGASAGDFAVSRTVAFATKLASNIESPVDAASKRAEKKEEEIKMKKRKKEIDEIVKQISKDISNT